MKTPRLLAAGALVLGSAQALAANPDKPSITAAVEANLRTIANQCGAGEFAQQFSQQSKDLIAQRSRATPGKNSEQTEAEITESMRTAWLDLYTPERCAKIMPELRDLFVERKKALTLEGQ